MTILNYSKLHQYEANCTVYSPQWKKWPKWLKFLVLMFQKINFKIDLGVVPTIITIVLDVFEDILIIWEPYMALMVTLGLWQIHQYEVNCTAYGLQRKKSSKWLKFVILTFQKNEFQTWFGDNPCNDNNDFLCVWRYFDDLRAIYGFDGHFGPLRDTSIWSKFHCV